MTSHFTVSINPNSIFAKQTKTCVPINVNTIQQILTSSWDKEYADSEEWCKRNNIPATTLTGKQHLQMVMKNIGDFKLQQKDIGRAYYSKGVSLSNLPRAVKQALQVKASYINDKPKYETILFDYDIENAQPTILLNIVRKAKVPKKEYKLLESYCQKREKLLKKMAKYLFGGISSGRSVSKTFMIAVINQCHIQSYLEEYSIDYSSKKANGLIDWVSKFQNQIRTIFEKYFMKHNEPFYNAVLLKCKKKQKARRSFIARILQHKENEVVELVLSTLINEKKIKAKRFDYAYDGFLLPEKIDVSLLNQICSDNGWDVKWTIKEPKEGIELLNDIYKLNHEGKEEVKHPDESLLTFDNAYFNSLYGNYDKLKDYFEKFYSFVKMPQPMYVMQGYIPSMLDGKKVYTFHFDYLPEAKIREQYKHICSRIETTKFGTTKKFPFINDYIEDRYKKVYERMDFVPFNSCKNFSFDKEILNTFTGYNPVCFKKGIKYNPKSIEKGGVLFAYREVLTHLLGGLEERKVFEYIMAHTIKYPSRKLPFAILIKGHQGSGKNTVLYQISKIISKTHYITTANIKDIVGTHSEGLMNKILVNINEVNFNETKNMGDVLKSLISENTKVFNMKYIRPVEQVIYALLVLTTNGKMPIPLDVMTGERRWIVCESDGANKQLKKERVIDGKKTTGWKYLHNNVWNTDEFVQQLYLYFMQLPVEDFDFQKAQTEMTRTPAYNKLASYFIDPLALMIRDYIISGSFDNNSVPNFDIDSDDENNCEIQQYYEKDAFYQFQTIKATDLRKYYESWYERYRGDATWVGIKNCKSFVNGIYGLPCKIEKKTKGGAAYFVFKPRDMLQELANGNIIQLDMSMWKTKKVEKEIDFGF